MDIKYQQHLSLLVLYYLKGTLNAEEQQELEAWRSASVRHEEMFRRMVSISGFEENYKRFVKNESDSRAEWEFICRRTVRKRNVWKRRVLRYAALWIVPLLVGGGVFYLWHHSSPAPQIFATAFVPDSSHAILELSNGTWIDLNKTHLYPNRQGENWTVSENLLKYQQSANLPEEQYHRLKIPRGGEYTLVLADGTKVFLNAESVLKYPVTFLEKCRKVSLGGEAYFEVARDTSRPFIVEVNQMEIEVLGTSFGVRNYPEETDIRTTLVSGKVNVWSGKKEFVLKPAEQAVYNKKSGEVRITTVDPELFVGWKDGRLIFDNSSLEQILKDLGRWYSFDVFYTRALAKEIPFSLNIRKHEKFSEVLKLIENTGKVRFEINKNTVIVK